MRWINRKTARVQFEHNTTLISWVSMGNWRRSCTLLDASASGAKLEVGRRLYRRTQDTRIFLGSIRYRYGISPVRVGLGQRATRRRPVHHGEDKGERAPGQE